MKVVPGIEQCNTFGGSDPAVVGPGGLYAKWKAGHRFGDGNINKRCLNCGYHIRRVTNRKGVKTYHHCTAMGPGLRSNKVEAGTVCTAWADSTSTRVPRSEL